MQKPNKPYDSAFDQEDYYLAQSRLLVDQYLVEHGLSYTILQEMPTEYAAEILKQALGFAAGKIARNEAMIRLGDHSSDTKEEPHPRHQHKDRLARFFWKGPVGSKREPSG